MNSPSYARASAQWSKWIGREAVVIGATFVRVAPQGFESLAPYTYALVEFADGSRAEFVGVEHDQLIVGDQVRCVWRRTVESDQAGVIGYGIKVKKLDK